VAILRSVRVPGKKDAHWGRVASIHELPRRGLLGNWVAGVRASRKSSYDNPGPIGIGSPPAELHPHETSFNTTQF
jgi:hypothetical protein